MREGEFDSYWLENAERMEALKQLSEMPFDREAWKQIIAHLAAHYDELSPEVLQTFLECCPKEFAHVRPKFVFGGRPPEFIKRRPPLSLK